MENEIKEKNTERELAEREREREGEGMRRIENPCSCS